MLPSEAQWFGRQLSARLPGDLYPLCNLGSASREFREQTQPWIDRYLFAPARATSRRVTHVDLTRAPGVDLVGDLNDAVFLAQLAAQGFRSLICANLLEHVVDPARMARDITSLVPAGGRLFISVPHRFPYHPDPIDTMFRPDPRELAALFPGTSVVVAEVVRAGTMLGYVLGRAMRPRALWRSIRGLRRAPPPGTAKVESSAAQESPKSPSPWRYVPWLVRSFEVSCVVLRKD